MVVVAQLVELRFVVPAVARSTRVDHPNFGSVEALKVRTPVCGLACVQLTTLD